MFKNDIDFIIKEHPALMNPDGIKITKKKMRKEIAKLAQKLEKEPLNNSIKLCLNKMRYICKLYFGQEDL